ncbi:MAG: glutamate--tRNA ligase, partial [Francisellaceae bacterium]|nr:glutamate--tRNA ligase [Francisellaceae bacterium]
MSVITRFPPSPTGYLHVGSARTALYSWLYARANQGKMVLRIEDTDRERSTDESVQAIFDGLAWLGLDWDEGPFYQTKRFARYKEVVDALLAQDKAYKCYCSKERLDLLREEQMANKEQPKYDGHCRNHPAVGNDFVIRFKNEEMGSVSFNDIVRGELTVANTQLDDLILVRSDNTPTYNFCVVVDDMDMGINYVIRGEDHISNTFRQINILKALNAVIPNYVHISMIHGEDGHKLSKRHGAVGVMSYRDDGFLPEALLNYLVRLGWSSGDKEIFSVEEMIDLFSLDNLQKSPAIFNQEKLLWLNNHYMKELPSNHVAKYLAWHFDDLGVNASAGPELEALIELQAPRCNTLKEIVSKSLYFYQDISLDPVAAKKHLKPGIVDALISVKEGLVALSYWDMETVKKVIHSVAEKFELKLGKIAQPIRVSIT